MAPVAGPSGRSNSKQWFTDETFQEFLDSRSWGMTTYRNFVITGDPNIENEANLSTGNTPPNTKFGVANFFWMDYSSLSWNEQGYLNSIRAGDYVFISRSDKYLLIKPEGVFTPNDATGTRQFWYDTPLFSRGLDQYGEMGTGQTKIQFSRTIPIDVDLNGRPHITIPHAYEDTGLRFSLPVTAPHGMVVHNEKMWVIDRSSDKAIGYIVGTIGAPVRAISLDFDLDSENSAPVGGCTDGTHIWIADNGDHKAYAYLLTTGAHVSSKDFNFDNDNIHATSMGTDGSVIWISDSGAGGDAKGYAYEIGSGAPTRASDKDFDFYTAITNAHGFAYDGGHLWVIDYDTDIAYGHRVTAGSAVTRLEHLDFSLATGNAHPIGSDTANGIIWIADNNNDEVYAYRIPGKYPMILANNEDLDNAIEAVRAYELANGSNPPDNVTGSDINFTADMDDYILIYVYQTAGTTRFFGDMSIRYGDIPTTAYLDTAVNDNSGSRLGVKRRTGGVTVRSYGNLDNQNRTVRVVNLSRIPA